jgi:hypothetical protein
MGRGQRVFKTDDEDFVLVAEVRAKFIIDPRLETRGVSNCLMNKIFGELREMVLGRKGLSMTYIEQRKSSAMDVEIERQWGITTFPLLRHEYSVLE